MHNQKYALLMTACIEPSASNVQNHLIHRSSPTTRLNDYKTALDFWLTYDEPLIESILFVENSGYQLNELVDLADENNIYNRKIEFLQFNASPIPFGLHYGYSELEILDYAFENSKLIKETDYIIKVTGRIFFPSLSDLIKVNRKEYDFMADCKDFNLLGVSKHYVITTIFVTSKDFYNRMLYNSKVLMSGMNCGLMEMLYFELLKPLHLKDPGKIMLRFPFNVSPVGIGAHWGVNYLSYKKRFHSFFISVCRKLLPNFWV